MVFDLGLKNLDIFPAYANEINLFFGFADVIFHRDSQKIHLHLQANDQLAFDYDNYKLCILLICNNTARNEQS